MRAPELAANDRSHVENAKPVRRAGPRLRRIVAPIRRHVSGDVRRFDIAHSEDDDINAYTSPPNRIAVNHGLVRYLHAEDEVATVLAHEIGHHLADRIDKTVEIENREVGATIAVILYGALGVYAGASGYDYDPNAFSRDLGGDIGTLSYSKEHERETDYLAADLLDAAGYDLDRTRAAWIALTKASGNTATTLFDTHPNGPERLAAWDRSVAEALASPDNLPNLLGETD